MRAAVLIIAVLACGMGGCVSPQSCATMMQSSDPLVRAKGCKLAGETKQTAVLGLLVDRLEDRDCAVRFFAATALRRITWEHNNPDLDYRESDGPARKKQVIENWRRYAARAGREGGGPG